MITELTKTERQVYQLIVLGLSNKEIAARQFVSVKTAKGHVTKILRAHECVSRAALIAKHYMAEIERIWVAAFGPAPTLPPIRNADDTFKLPNGRTL